MRPAFAPARAGNARDRRSSCLCQNTAGPGHLALGDDHDALGVYPHLYARPYLFTIDTIGEHLVHHRLQIVVDPPAAHSSEELEGAHVGIKNYLPDLTRVGYHKKVPTVAQPQMRHLRPHRHPGHLHQLVAPVELKGFPGVKHQRDVDLSGQAALPLALLPHLPPNAVIAARVAPRPGAAQRALWRSDVGAWEASDPLPNPSPGVPQMPQGRARLKAAPIRESSLLTAHRLPNGVAGNSKLFGCLPD